MKKIVFTLLLMFSFMSLAIESVNNDFQIALNGSIQKNVSLKEMKSLKSTNVDFFNHITRKSDTFQGVTVLSLLNFLDSEDVKKIVEVELTSMNGYKAYFPIQNFYKVDAIISYAIVGESKFERFSQKEKKMVPLGPYYLIWDFKTIRSEDKNQYGSVYQITKINFITSTVDFGIDKISEAQNDQSIKLGYRTYKKYCLSCHALGTWGGEVGADLIKKKTLSTHGPDFLIKYILEPTSVNPQTKMLALPKYKNSQAMANGIVDFLAFIENPSSYLKAQKIENDKPRYQALKTMLNDVRGKAQN